MTCGRAPAARLARATTAPSAPRRVRSGAVRLATLAAVALAAGCSAVQRAQDPEPVTHVLALTAAVRGDTPRRDAVIEVGTPRAAPGYETPRIAYVWRSYELDYFARARWADTPARMLGSVATQALEQAGGFRAVVSAASGMPADLRLGIELIRLQQDFSTTPSRVRLTLRVQLVDARSRRVVATAAFDEMEDAASEDAYGGVVAANVALQRAVAGIVRFCSENARP